MSTQLQFGNEIISNRDSENNIWAITDNTVTLKLAREGFVRKLGIIVEERFIVYRDKAKHLFHKTNSYGFNYDVILDLERIKGIKYVDLYDDAGLFRLSIEQIKRDGEFLFFKEKGFEKQLFVPIDKIYKYNLELPEDKNRINLLGNEWFHKLKAEFHKPYWKELGMYVAKQRQVIDVYPEPEDVFAAYKNTPYSKVKVVIIGQDPYYNPGIADGLAFSCKMPHYVPPSLEKIYEGMESDIHNGLFLDNNPSLMYLALQGVLLINPILTVEYKQPGSHKGAGWEHFTDRVLAVLKEHDRDLVFMLWGGDARAYKPQVQNSRHLILEAEHPAYAHRQARKWDNKECFKKANSFLTAKGYGTINW